MSRKVVNIISLFTFLITSVFFIGSSRPDEGMYPLSELGSINLREAGLKIDISEIYNPNGVSHVDALVRVGGCTGSFVSEEGLILTNHHCSFDYVRQASTVENNYLENGFLAKDKSAEIPAQGLTCLITTGYEDVSEKVLQFVQGKEGAERISAINKIRREIVDAYVKSGQDLSAEVAEMFIGKTYILFKYKEIKDVRLVYIPPRSIGEFGGETDNWVWPRHTGDFAFLRAYVAPDGSSKPYSTENVPFKPAKHIEVNPKGVKEGDFVFVLGYPGRTFRNRPAEYLRVEEDVRLPKLQFIFAKAIEELHKLSKQDPELSLAVASKIKMMANVEKNYRGKMLGMSRLSLVDKKRAEERELQDFIDRNESLKSKYGNLISSINAGYKASLDEGAIPYAGLTLNRFSVSFQIIDLLAGYLQSRTQADDKRTRIYQDANIDDLIDEVESLFSSYFPEADAALFGVVADATKKYPELQSSELLKKYGSAVKPYEQGVEDYTKALQNSPVMTREGFFKFMKLSIEELKSLNDPLVEMVMELNKYFDESSDKLRAADGKLNPLLADYVNVMMEFKAKSFIPDANSTIRLTYGYIQGYMPADATYYKPITTLKGVIEKSFSSNKDFTIPAVLRDLYAKRDFGAFKDEELDDVPVAILYNLDTTGGNSGSPVMDAFGRLIGLNFDRAFEATVNDYAWSQLYSRSIGVDIRYILWVTQKVGGADYILKELKVM